MTRWGEGYSCAARTADSPGRGMKSIRLSLIVYFLLLLGAAWGTASWLVYRSAADDLKFNFALNRELMQMRSSDRSRKFVTSSTTN